MTLSVIDDVVRDGVRLAGGRARDLVRALVLAPAGTLTTAAVARQLWDEDRPAHPDKAVQVVVARLRAQWGADAVVTGPDGYRLVDAAGSDLRRAVAAADDAATALRDGRPHEAVPAADAALAVLSASASAPASASASAGSDPEGADASPAGRVAAEAASARATAVRVRALALVDLGRPAEALPVLRALADGSGDEALLARLLRAEAAVEGPAVALARYETHRRRLRDSLGAEPGTELTAVHTDLLAGERGEETPAAATALIGRDDAIDAVVGMTRSSRVTTIVGPGGLGKTTLALAVADRLSATTVFYVELVTITAGDDLDAYLAGQLGGAGRNNPAGATARTARQVVLDRLRDSRAVLVLDNCEQIVDAVADLVAAIVATCRHVTVLATSRAPLRIGAEAVFTPRQLTLGESTELFVRRARAVRPGAVLDEADVAAVCERLDGLPLAIELAASRVRTLTVADIAARLTDRFALLRGRDRDRPDRHRTLQAVIAWSWDMLDVDQQHALAALTVFPDAFTPHAATAVLAGGDAEPDAEEVLDALVDQSLLAVVEAGRPALAALLPAPGVRFRLLETVREFAASRQPDGASVRDRFVGWAADLAAGRRDALHGQEQASALSALAADGENLNRALRSALETDDARALTIAASLGMAWGLMDEEATLTAVAGPLGLLARTVARRLVNHGGSAAERSATADTLAVLILYTRLDAGGNPTERTRARNVAALRALLATMPAAAEDGEPDQVHALRSLARRFPSVLRLMTRNDAFDAAPDAGVSERVATAFLGSFITENQGRLADAIADLASLVPLLGEVTPWLRAGVYLRIGELCLGRADGDGARRWVEPVLPVLATLGSAENLVQAHALCLMAALGRGDLGQARAHLAVVDRVPLRRAESTAPFRLVATAVTAEIAAAEGRVEEADRILRELTADARDQAAFFENVDRPNVWYASAAALNLAVLARYQRPLTGDDVVAEMGTWLLSTSGFAALPWIDRPQYGTLVFALAAWLLAAGQTRDATASSRAGARLLAVALRLEYNRTYPSMGLEPALSQARAAAADALEAESAVLAGIDDDDLLARCRDVLAEELPPWAGGPGEAPAPADSAPADSAQVRLR